MKTKERIWFGISLFLLLISIYQAIFLKQPHFYSLFSVGMFIILLLIYNSISKEKMFRKWGRKEFVIFFVLLIITSIIIDKIGLYLGYWIYPNYHNGFDEILKYPFEYAIPFCYLMFGLLIGQKLFQKLKINRYLSFILSLVIIVTLLGLFTEAVNMQVYSWKVMSMPITNYTVNNLFLVWQTIGYWLMASITFILYKFTEGIK